MKGRRTPVWRDKHTKIAKQFEEDLKTTPKSEHIHYPSYSAFMESVYDKKQ